MVYMQMFNTFVWLPFFFLMWHQRKIELLLHPSSLAYLNSSLIVSTVLKQYVHSILNCEVRMLWSCCFCVYTCIPFITVTRGPNKFKLLFFIVHNSIITINFDDSKWIQNAAGFCIRAWGLYPTIIFSEQRTSVILLWWISGYKQKDWNSKWKGKLFVHFVFCHWI